MTNQALAMEVRRHNGQNAYGAWETYSRKTHPHLLGEELWDVTGNQGIVEVGGQKWAWRRLAGTAKKAKIQVVNTGVNFGTYARIKSGRKLLHETTIRPHGMSGVAIEDAISWCTKNGYACEIVSSKGR